MSIYVVNAGQYEVFADRAALKAAVEKAVREERHDYDGVEVIEGAALAFSVETEPRVTIGDPVAPPPARKPRAAKPVNAAIVEALRTAIMPGEQWNIGQLSTTTGKHTDDLRVPLEFLIKHGEVATAGRGRGRTYRAIPGAVRAAVPGEKVAQS